VEISYGLEEELGVTVALQDVEIDDFRTVSAIEGLAGRGLAGSSTPPESRL